MNAKKVDALLRKLDVDVTRIDALALTIRTLETARDRELAEVRTKHNKRIDPLIGELRSLYEERVYAPIVMNEEQRTALLERVGAKTIGLTAGSLKFYLSPNPRLVKEAAKHVLAELRRKGMMRLFTKRTISIQWEKIKRALQANEVTLSTVRLEQPEFSRLTLRRSNTDLSFDETGAFTREVQKEEKKTE